MDPKINDKHIRYAPSFVSGTILRAGTEHAYTEQSLARFLGMTQGDGDPQEKFRAAFGALELIEQGYLKENQLDDERMGRPTRGLRANPACTLSVQGWGSRIGSERRNQDGLPAVCRPTARVIHPGPGEYAPRAGSPRHRRP